MTGVVPSGGRDPGLQPERTAMAWSRTALSVVVGSLLAARLLGPHLGGAAVVLGALGVAAGLALTVAAPRRELRTPAGRRPDGRLLAVVAAGCLLAGLAGVGVLAATLATG